MTDISPRAARITAPGLFPDGAAAGRLSAWRTRSATHRVSDDSTEAQTEESRTPEQATATVARMLANPRRVRRN